MERRKQLEQRLEEARRPQERASEWFHKVEEECQAWSCGCDYDCDPPICRAPQNVRWRYEMAEDAMVSLDVLIAELEEELSKL